jgi:hypothetical protein
MTAIKLYGRLEKAVMQDDGTLIVRGVASSEAVDAEGETIRADAIKAAIPDYMAFGAVREMHQPIAAGVALKCEVAADGKTHIEARVVDPVTIRKVESGVLKGFSVGGKVTGRDSLDKTVITGIRLTEISLVDRPCNPEALVSLCKLGGSPPPDHKGGSPPPDQKVAAADEDDDENEKEGGEDDDDAADGEGEGKDEDGDEDEDEGGAKKLSKLAMAHGDALSKILSLEGRLAKANAELAKYKNMPAPPKGAVRAIGKGEDVPGADGATAELQKMADAIGGMPPIRQAAALVHLIHTSTSNTSKR